MIGLSYAGWMHRSSLYLTKTIRKNYDPTHCTFETPHASKYLQQLCKHFQHKVDASFDETSGTVALPYGTTTLAAAANTLTVEIALAAGATEKDAKYVIDSHLEKFAFRESFRSMQWA